MRFRRIGMIARWKPVHLGHAAVLRALDRAAGELVLGIGSSNAYDPRNPFTAAESEAMIRLVLGEREGTEILPLPDLFDGPRWRDMVVERLGDLDAFVTANRWVAELLRDTWPLLHPVTLVPEGDRVPVEGRMVREAMARGGDWQRLVPETVAAYLRAEGLDERFRRDFGLHVLASLGEGRDPPG